MHFMKSLGRLDRREGEYSIFMTGASNSTRLKYVKEFVGIPIGYSCTTEGDSARGAYVDSPGTLAGTLATGHPKAIHVYRWQEWVNSLSFMLVSASEMLRSSRNVSYARGRFWTLGVVRMDYSGRHLDAPAHLCLRRTSSIGNCLHTQSATLEGTVRMCSTLS